jgi:UDP-glucose 4-epimerase
MPKKTSNKSRLSGKRILLTGATGFVGAHLLRELLKHDCQIHLIIKSQSQKWRIADILSDSKITVHEVALHDFAAISQLVKTIQPTVIYHLAARGAYSSQNDWRDIMETNLVGTWNLMMACQDIDYELFVNTSSSSEYGFQNEPMSEKQPAHPNSFYAVAKAASTLLAEYLGSVSAQSQPIVTLRLFSVYGPYEEPSRFFPTVWRAIHQRQTIQLVSPTTARDFIHIDDVVAAYLAIDDLKKHPGACFNVGTGQQSTMSQVMSEIQNIAEQHSSSQKLKLEWGAFPARSWDAQTWVADMSHTFGNLEWRPELTLKAGLEKTWQWYATHREYLA